MRKSLPQSKQTYSIELKREENPFYKHHKKDYLSKKAHRLRRNN